MSIETNKQVATEYFAALSRNDVPAMSACMTDDCAWWIVPGTAFSGARNKASFLDNIPKLYDGAAGPLEFEFHEIVAEDDHVSLVAKGNLPLKDGRVYANNYSYLLTFRDGRSRAARSFSTRPT